MRVGGLLSGLASVGVLLVFAAIFVVTFGKTWRAQSWPETSCEIFGARVVKDVSSDGEDWDVRISWRYEVDGTHYELIDHAPEVFGLSYDREEAEAVVAGYVVGSRVRCYYDPDEPRTSTLDRSPPPTSAVVFAVVVALGLLVAGVVALWRRARE